MSFPPVLNEELMKTVKITLGDPPGRQVHDSEGRKHADGTIVTLSDADADLFVSRRLAVFVDESSRIEAERANRERHEAGRLAQQKRRSEQAMMVHDSLPAEVRAVVHEMGDEVTETYLAGLAREDDEPKPAKLNRKQRRMMARGIEGGDVG